MQGTEAHLGGRKRGRRGERVGGRRRSVSGVVLKEVHLLLLLLRLRVSDVNIHL